MKRCLVQVVWLEQFSKSMMWIGWICLWKYSFSFEKWWRRNIFAAGENFGCPENITVKFTKEEQDVELNLQIQASPELDVQGNVSIHSCWYLCRCFLKENMWYQSNTKSVKSRWHGNFSLLQVVYKKSLLVSESRIPRMHLCFWFWTISLAWHWVGNDKERWCHWYVWNDTSFTNSVECGTSKSEWWCKCWKQTF